MNEMKAVILGAVGSLIVTPWFWQKVWKLVRFISSLIADVLSDLNTTFARWRLKRLEKRLDKVRGTWIFTDAEQHAYQMIKIIALGVFYVGLFAFLLFARLLSTFHKTLRPLAENITQWRQIGHMALWGLLAVLVYAAVFALWSSDDGIHMKRTRAVIIDRLEKKITKMKKRAL